MRTTKLIFLSLIATLASFGQCVLVFNPLTNQFNCGGGAAGGSVGGASNLTTVGAIPYVSAAGILNQDPTALFWDAANDRLGIGNNSPAAPVDIRFGIANVGGIRIQNTNSGVGYSAIEFMRSNGSYGGGIGWGNDGTAGAWKNSVLLWALSGNPIRFTVDGGGTTAATFAATTGNLLIGTTTDSNFKLDVAASGSAGTARFYDQTATTGVTRVVVRAGAGQSTTSLTEWQNASTGAVLASVSASGFGSFSGLSSSGSISASTDYTMGPGSQLISTGRSKLYSPADGNWVMWNNAQAGFTALQLGGTTSSFPALKRSSATLEVKLADDSAFTELALLRSRHNGVTVADLPTAAAGNAGSIQYVTDANATTIGSTVAGGGANKVMVWSDGAAWKIFAN